MTKPFPPELTMIELMGLRGNDAKVGEDGLFYLVVEGDEHPISAESLDDLDGRGWIEIGDDAVKITEKGNYWLERWSLKRFGRTDLKLTTQGDQSWANPTISDVSYLFE